MKKQDIKAKKLDLKRETVSTLQGADLENVNGGIIWTVVPVSVALTLLFCAAGKAR